MKPPLVLHICCAPDEAWVVHTLVPEFELHCFFCNPNITPHSEYELRIAEARRVAEHYGVPFFADTCDAQSWETSITPYADTPEGGERCRACFDLRLRRTAAFCAREGFPAFTTVMSVSPHKRIAMLNESGCAAAREYGIEYRCYDFKKQDGFRKSIALSKELSIYRQDYCGCRLSLAERDKRNAGRTVTKVLPPARS
jgi:predicted adenine nucleotide alpha hydrolase (AANH) superfamily ATPase